MEEPIEQRGDGGGVAEQLAPVVDGSVRRQQRRRAFVAAHDHFQEIFGGGVRQFPHAEVVDDQQRHGREIGEVGLAGAVERGVGDFLERACALRDRGRDSPAGSPRGRWLAPDGSSRCLVGRERARPRAAR